MNKIVLINVCILNILVSYFLCIDAAPHRKRKPARKPSKLSAAIKKSQKKHPNHPHAHNDRLSFIKDLQKKHTPPPSDMSPEKERARHARRARRKKSSQQKQGHQKSSAVTISK